MTLVYLIVILISFAILGVSMIKMFENYYFEKRSEALIESGEKLNKTVIQYLNNTISYERLSVELESIERFLNAKIWVIDKSGRIYGISSVSEQEWIGKQISNEDKVRVLQGKIISKMGEYDEVFGVPVLTVGMPIYINNVVINAVFMHTPVYEIDETLHEVYKIILTSMAVALIIATLLIYYTSQRISKPLTEINSITKKIASGEFHKRLNIKSNDEIGQLSQSFNNMAKDLEKLEEMRKGFIADVSHELRSPLTLIKGYIKGLMDENLSDEKRNQYVKIIYGETERLTELINNLLDLSRMESGNYPLNIVSFDINELLRRNIIKFGNKLEEKNIDVDVDFQEDPLKVRGEMESISQVISNIIDNAIKFMNNDSEDKLMITSCIKNEKAYISIADTGLGIPNNEKENIWKRFYKGDKSRSRQIKGTGLGLSIVKEIIKNHGEDIWIESEVNKGTKFTFTLDAIKNEQ
ncbi:sensor histidine kinase [Sporosalibacterium faouarense]|uniref:sensor histidine kinase n=1 Tax=Sporosalibacterium faouarense TaxID=516123 RepID=UPI001A9C53E3|nr:HAMP domain-containing sensor histidine kinase [Sporosalibacterium faouarense]